MANIYNWDCDAFDNGSSGAFEVKGTGTVIDTDVKTQGTGSMKIVCAGGTPDDGDRGYKELNGAGVYSMEFGGSYFNRFWMKIDSGFTWSSANKLKACRWKRGSDISDFMTGYISSGGVLPGEHGGFGWNSDQGAGSGGEGPTISYDFNPSTNTAVQDWQEYIVEFKIQSSDSAADGHMKFYVNGSLIGSLTGVTWFTGADTSLQEIWAPFMQFCFPQTATGSFWIDDVSVDTTFNSNYSAPAVTARIGTMSLR